MQDQFTLSSEEHDAVYYDQVEPYAFAGTTAVEHPILIMIGGQPGAGKTKLLDRSIDRLSGNAVKINVDDLRRFHPNKDEIRAFDDKRYAERTQTDASAWALRLIDRASAESRNIVLETAMRNPEQICQILPMLTQSNYECEVCMVATHEKVSMASVYYRYEHKKSSEKGYGRWVSSALHQQSFHGVFESARRIEDNMLSNGIKIFDRSGSLLFENSLARGKWKKLPRAARIIEVERSRVLSKNEIDDYESTWDKVFDYLIDRQAPQHEIDEARNLYKSFASQIRKEPKKK